MNARLRTYLFLLIASLSSRCYAPSADNVFFYRASYFFGETRLEQDKLTTVDVFAGAGSTTHSRNSCGQKTCLLNLWGLYNMPPLGIGVPGKDLSNPVDVALVDLAQLSSDSCFGFLSFDGKFLIRELFICLTQNIVNGFFIHAEIPYRDLIVKDICYRDLSPKCGPSPNALTPEWQTFLNLFDQVLMNYHLNPGPTHNRGIGDVSAYIGWTRNYHETTELDFIDTTFKVGVVIPSAATPNPNNIFELPLGHDHHIGIPFTFDLGVGAYDWITFGGHFSAVIFLRKSQTIRMKTDIAQSGAIKLASGKACITPGVTWLTGAYFKADHFFRGLSALAAYSFAKQNRSRINPCDCKIFDQCIAESDQRFAGWSMHTINLLADYDFARKDTQTSFRLGAFYNIQIGGHRVFMTNVGGGSFGIDVGWSFN